jgi:hypothetical protein
MPSRSTIAIANAPRLPRAAAVAPGRRALLGAARGAGGALARSGHPVGAVLSRIASETGGAAGREGVAGNSRLEKLPAGVQDGVGVADEKAVQRQSLCASYVDVPTILTAFSLTFTCVA